jgi:ribosome-binding protein aMBF1 (putative translation factor)
MRYLNPMPKKDFLDEIIEEGTKSNPKFPEMMDAAYRRRVLLRELATKRESAGITQKDVAAAMKTSQSAVARMERGEIDAKLSTVERYAAVLGHTVEWRLKKNPTRAT